MKYTLSNLTLDGSVPPESPLYNVLGTFGDDYSPEPDLIHTWVEDPDWEWTDSRGHEHYQHLDGTFPTLRPVSELVPGCGECCGVYEDYSVTRSYECVGCGDSIPSEKVGKKLDWWRPETITLKRFVYSGEPRDLMGIEPISWDGTSDHWCLTYRPTWDQWLMLVEEHNRIIREAG